MLMQNVFNFMKYKQNEKPIFTEEKTEDIKNDNFVSYYSGFENNLVWLNGLFLYFFNPLMNYKNNPSVFILETNPFFKKIQLIVLLFVFSYIVFYFFSFFIKVENYYCSSSFWLWIIMILIIFIVSPFSGY